MFYKSATDARHFTDYKSNCISDIKLMKDNGIKSQYEYRKFLQENAKTIIDNDRKVLEFSTKKEEKKMI